MVVPWCVLLCLNLVSAASSSNNGTSMQISENQPHSKTVELYTLWSHFVPAPVGFSKPEPKVYNTSILNAVAYITITPSEPESETQHVQVRGYFDYQNNMGIVNFRYAPMQLGVHSIVLTVNGHIVPCNRCIFTAVASSSKNAGFVRVGANRQHFITTNKNQTYFGIGENLAWTADRLSYLGAGNQWEAYLTNLSQAGANYIRVWLTDGWDDLFVETQLGNYSVTNTANIDRLLDLAEALGIKILMCTESFNFFCSKPKPDPCKWSECVYNKANGGFLSGAAEFFTNERAKNLYKQRLQYLVSRYGHSTAVFAWEFFNEIDIVDGYKPELIAEWTDEMAHFVRSIDIYDHPISTSFCCSEPEQVWQLPSMDFVMVHTYSRHNKTDMADNSQYYTVATSRHFQKPTYVAETGENIPGKNHDFPADPTGIGLHNAMWASVTSMGAMTSMVWWWDSWVAPHNLYHHFTAVRKFSDSIDWVQHSWSPIGRNATSPCTDINPDNRIPPQYTCAQQASWGKCDGAPNGTNPWMKGMCCKTCHPTDIDACRKCSAERSGDDGGSHKAVSVGSWSRAYGMAGRPLGDGDGDRSDGNGGRGGDAANSDGGDGDGAYNGGGDDGGGDELDSAVSIVVMWVQNVNNTFSQQNATKPDTSRPPLLPIKDLKIDLNTIPLPSGMLGLNGHFSVKFTDTNSGAVSYNIQGLQCPLHCTVNVPVFSTDIAITVRANS